MIAVDLITEQELDKRYVTLSSKLKDALTSERTLSVVDQICKKNNIVDEEKVLIVHQIVGLVILGLVHSYDLGSEINEALSLENPKFSNAIAEELNSKVFSQITTELESNYRPINSTPSEQKNLSPKPIAATSSTTPAPKSISLSDIGWSKQPAAETAINANIPKPTPVASTTTAPKAPAPAPMMLHEDTTFKSAEKNLNFSLAKPGDTNEMKAANGVPQAPARAAVLEFGTVPTPQAKPAVPKPPLSSAPMPTISTGARNVSQITAAIAAPAVPKPISVPVPKPLAPTPIINAVPVPRPPQQPNKAIVKDFI